MAYRNNVLDLTLSSDEDDHALPRRLAPVAQVERPQPATKRRPLPRIVDSEDDEDDEEPVQRAHQSAQAPGKARPRIVDSEDEEEEEGAERIPTRKISPGGRPVMIDSEQDGEDEEQEPDTESEGEGEQLGEADTSRDDEGSQDDEEEEDDSFIDDGDTSFATPGQGRSSDYRPTPSPRPSPRKEQEELQKRPSRPAVAAPPPKPAAPPHPDQLSDSEQLRQYGFVLQPSSNAFPTKAQPPPHAQKPPPFQSVGNTLTAHGFGPRQPPNPLFNTSAAARKPSGGFASSSAAFVAPPQQMSAKDRILQQMKEQSQKMGVPIAVPNNPPAVKSNSSKDGLIDVLDDEKALAKAMQDLNVGDLEDQEAALKELVSSTVNMEGVDESELQPDGLKVTLLPHQMQGLHWLKSRESKSKRGGILADDMGLGKTIQLLALMLAHPNEDRETCRSKTTLIVCPPSLMAQWESEIKTKSDGRLKVFRHHGPNRPTDGRKLSKYHVVITSYQICSSEWVDPKPKKGKGKKAAGSDDEDDYFDKATGALFDPDYSFYRVILDEAHQIKGRSTKMHKSCCALKSRYRWCLTGTPIQNGVIDLFALFEFLGRVVRPMDDYSHFKLKIGDLLKAKNTERQKTGYARLKIILDAVMLRRRKTDVINGKPLITLPKREIIEVKTPFLDSEEAEFYRAIAEAMQLEMNAFIKAGTVMQNMTAVLLKLLRMRQACSHPALVTKDWEVDDEDLNPVPETAAANASTAGDDGLSSLLGGLSLAGSSSATATCLLCPSPVACAGETYCFDCAASAIQISDRLSSTKVKQTIKLLAEIKRESAAEKERVREENRRRKELEEEDGEERERLVYRPKKTIIFSQFTSMFEILEPYLKKAGYRYTRFDGKLNAKKKEEALEKIREDPLCTVILVSLKCGAVGLNLTCCSRVLLLDLWWNPAIEQQAFDRAHRFGQTDNVKIYKILIENTVEDRILALQESKAEIAKAAIEGGGDVKAASKLNLRDILYLFKGESGVEPRRSRLDDAA
ncbi:hypothetical protein JCM6882_007810 [Rhodosporidiobolus microsporus]